MTPVEWLEQEYDVVLRVVERPLDYDPSVPGLTLLTCPDWDLGVTTARGSGANGPMFDLKDDNYRYEDMYSRPVPGKASDVGLWQGAHP